MGFVQDLLLGKKPKVILRGQVKGIPDASLKRKISLKIKGYLAQHQHAKIGKTGAPSIRGDQKDYRGVYKKMHILYKSKSKRNVSMLESYFVTRFYNQLGNIDKHSAGRMRSYNGYYYLYIVVSDTRKQPQNKSF